MKFLCLAYGDEKGWNLLTEAEKKEVLANDAIIRARGNLMSSVTLDCTTVTNWNHKLQKSQQPFSPMRLPLAGFSIIEAENVEEVLKLVSNTPCARAGGAIEIRPLS